MPLTDRLRDILSRTLEGFNLLRDLEVVEIARLEYDDEYADYLLQEALGRYRRSCETSREQLLQHLVSRGLLRYYHCYACGKEDHLPCKDSISITSCRHCDRPYPQVRWYYIESWQYALQFDALIDDEHLLTRTPDTSCSLMPVLRRDLVEIRRYLIGSSNLVRLGLAFAGGNIVVAVPADQDTGALRSMLDRPLAAILADLHRTGDLDATKLSLRKLLGESA